MRIRLTAFTIGLIIYFFTALFYDYTNSGSTHKKPAVTDQSEALSNLDTKDSEARNELLNKFKYFAPAFFHGESMDEIKESYEKQNVLRLLDYYGLDTWYFNEEFDYYMDRVKGKPVTINPKYNSDIKTPENIVKWLKENFNGRKRFFQSKGTDCLQKHILESIYGSIGVQ